MECHVANITRLKQKNRVNYRQESNIASFVFGSYFVFCSLRHISIIFPSSALQEIIALITTRARNSAHIKSVRERFINAITVFKRKQRL